MLTHVPNYSLLIYTDTLSEQTIRDVRVYLNKGIKIYLLSLDPIEEIILDDPFLKLAHDLSILRFYEVRFNSQLSNVEFVIVDGLLSNNIALLELLNNNSTFNLEQYILEHDVSDHHLIVKAGAGTGKTTVMLDRLMFLKHLNPAISFKEIILITFTNEAAINIRTKLLNRLSNYFELTNNPMYLQWTEEITEMVVGTIHSFAMKFIRQEGVKIGYMPNMKVRSYHHERRTLIEKWFDHMVAKYPDIFKQFKYIPQFLIINSIMTIIHTIRNKSLTLDEIRELDFGDDSTQIHIFLKEIINHVEEELTQIKKEEQAVEISDLISELKKFTFGIQGQESRTIRLIMVDEFQDTDEAQVSFLSWIEAQYQTSLFVVGDVKQSIYRFRGADYTAFEQLKNTLQSPFMEIALVKNYRSTETLLSDFEKQFDCWSKKVATFPYNPSDKLLPTIEAQDDYERLTTLKMEKEDLRHILSRLQEKDVAILVRSNREVDEMAEECECMGFPCETAKSGTFFRSLPVREFYLLIRRFTHPTNWKERYALHISSYGENTINIQDVIKKYTQEKHFLADLLQGYEIFEEEQKSFQTTPILNVLENLINRVKPWEQYRKSIYAEMLQKNQAENKQLLRNEAIARMKEYEMNLQHLLYLLKKEFADAFASLYKIERFLSIKMSTDTMESEFRVDDEGKHRIKIMTVHKSKGLEFDYVILPKTNSAFIKNGKTNVILRKTNGKWEIGYRMYWRDNTITNQLMEQFHFHENEELIGEETRLLYVALTRAKRGVYANTLSHFTEVRTIQRWSDLLHEGEKAYV